MGSNPSASISRTNAASTLVQLAPLVRAPFTASFADQSSGDIDTRTWDFGDGDAGTGAVVTHTYLAAGSYTAVVTASNDGTARVWDAASGEELAVLEGQAGAELISG